MYHSALLIYSIVSDLCMPIFFYSATLLKMFTSSKRFLVVSLGFLEKVAFLFHSFLFVSLLFFLVGLLL